VHLVGFIIRRFFFMELVGWWGGRVGCCVGGCWHLTYLLKTFTNEGSCVPLHKTYNLGIHQFDTRWWWKRGPTSGLDLVAERESACICQKSNPTCPSLSQ